MIKPDFIVIEPSIVGSVFSGFETIYGWNGKRFPTADAAISAGFESRGSDDFNICKLEGNCLVEFRWMEQPMNDPEGMREIAKQHGFSLRAPVA